MKIIVFMNLFKNSFFFLMYHLKFFSNCASYQFYLTFLYNWTSIDSCRSHLWTLPNVITMKLNELHHDHTLPDPTSYIKNPSCKLP